ncbi:MAG: thioredoxin family protein [Actinomycetia bacterium]|nr:thioredoxin family protein [Actinomycetes bacterium]
MGDKPVLPDGLVAVVKRDCPTCELVVPVLGQLAEAGPLAVYSQDDPGFPEGLGVVDDTDLAVSWHHDIETVPTLIRVEGGVEQERVVGWARHQWEACTGRAGLGVDLTDYSPGCGSLSVDPSLEAELAVRFGGETIRSRRVAIAELEDEFEAMWNRGWSDGLPVVPPTAERVLRMLEGTTRAPDEVVAIVPPNRVECTVEKVAVNAVMAGCKPDYLPVVLAAVEAACTDTFNMHGLLCTLWFSGPVVIVSGPIRQQIGMNSTKNALGQGNRANSTIGRALQLVVRNVGGGQPGEGGIDRSALGAPSKVGWCFAEDEEGLPDGWPPLHVHRGFDADQSTVTLFAGHGPIGAIDQVSRTPESLTRSLGAQLRSVGHPKLPNEAMMVMTPEHQRVYAEAGWTRTRFDEELEPLLQLETDRCLKGVDGIEEGLDARLAGRTVRKLPEGSPLVVRAGGGAGAFSAIIGGWVPGNMGSTPITHPIGS